MRRYTSSSHWSKTASYCAGSYQHFNFTAFALNTHSLEIYKKEIIEPTVQWMMDGR